MAVDFPLNIPEPFWGKTYFWAVLDLCCCMDFFLVAASGRYSLAAVLGLLIEVASLVVEYRL